MFVLNAEFFVDLFVKIFCLLEWCDVSLVGAG